MPFSFQGRDVIVTRSTTGFPIERGTVRSAARRRHGRAALRALFLSRPPRRGACRAAQTCPPPAPLAPCADRPCQSFATGIYSLRKETCLLYRTCRVLVQARTYPPTCRRSPCDPYQRERERDSLTYSSLEFPRDIFSLISYRYRKIPDPELDKYSPETSSVDYPFSYPFFTFHPSFSNLFQQHIENTTFPEKKSFFSAFVPLALRTELPTATLPPVWPAGVFFIYGTFLLPPAPGDTRRIRGPPLTALRLPCGYVRDTHACLSTRLKRTFH